MSSTAVHADWLWNRTIIPGVGTIRAAAYGGGIFVAGTNTGYLLGSRDGVNWTSSRPTTLAINGIVFGNGRFVACTASTSNVKSKILYSTDGTAWTFARRVANHGRFSSQSTLTDLATKSGRFIAMGPGAAAFASSINGARWQDPLDGRKPAKYVGSITGLATSGGYILCSTQAGATIQTSSDGVSWTTRFSSSPRGPTRGIAAQKPGHRVLAVGENGLCLVSANDGASWHARTFGGTDLLGVAYANKLFVSFSDKAVYSTNSGSNWSRQLKITRNGDHLRAITGGAGLTIAAGNNGKNALIMAGSGIPAPATPQ